MSNSITGRDAYIVAQALVYASEFLACLPIRLDEPSNRADMDDLLSAKLDDPSLVEAYRRAAQEKLAAVNLTRRHDDFAG
jgi:hypothetical protein